MDSETFNNLGKKAGELYKNFTSNKDYNQFFVISIAIVFFILFALISWIYSKLNLKNKTCNRLDILYPTAIGNSFMHNGGSVKSAVKDVYDTSYSSILKNYYVKTAYNCCCGDGYKNNFVNICALEKCIQAGARCLDFEIYSYNNEPIVASSTANDNNIKETYNYLNLNDVFDTLNRMSFKDQETSCANDPMFLHFRIMSTNKNIFNKMAEYIETILDKNPDGVNSYLLNGYNFSDTNNKLILIDKIKNFYKKFIIMVTTNPNDDKTLLDTELKKYVNIRSGTSGVLKIYRYDQMIGYSNSPVLNDEVKDSIVLVLPNINNNLDNYDFTIPQRDGCQFLAMKFQNMDNNLIAYNELFKEKGNYSLVLKPLHLRKDLIKEFDTPSGITVNNTTTDDMTDALLSGTP